MASITSGFGIVLIILGVAAYLGTGMVSVTALIPAFFGLPILGLGMLARKDSWRVLAVVAAWILAVAGLGGSAMGLPKAWTLLTGGNVDRPEAAVVQSIMAILCALFAVYCAWWLTQLLRRGRTQQTMS
jgi:hypothetical protein